MLVRCNAASRESNRRVSVYFGAVQTNGECLSLDFPASWIVDQMADDRSTAVIEPSSMNGVTRLVGAES